MEWGKTPATWNGQAVFVKEGNLLELCSTLPEFELMPFGINEDLNQVVRKPTLEEPCPVPVGVVSKNYKLIQHPQIFEWLQQGIIMAGLSEQQCKTELYLSHYGERMLLWMSMKQLDFDPGDGHPLGIVIACQNSVEKSCALEVYMMRIRYICSNGQILGNARTIRRKHVQQNDRRMDIAGEVAACLKWAAKEQIIYSQWLNTRVRQDTIDTWVDTTVQKAWGVNEAARVAAICRTGLDGEVKRSKDTPPSQLQVGWMDEVPGACAPVENAYHAAQALSWVASRHPALEERMQMLKAIPGLIEELSKE